MVEVESASTIFCFRCCVSQVPCHPVKGRKRWGLRHVDVKNGWMDGWTDGRTDARTDGRTDGWMDGWMCPKTKIDGHILDN